LVHYIPILKERKPLFEERVKYMSSVIKVNFEKDPLSAVSKFMGLDDTPWQVNGLPANFTRKKFQNFEQFHVTQL
jgi:hypothetical protein